MPGKMMKKRSRKSGLPPGTIIHIGERKTERARIRLIRYGDGEIEEKEITDISALKSLKGGISWVNVDGVHDVEVLEKLGTAFGLHPLVVEDIANTDQRPKMEDFGDYLYIVLRMLDHTQEGLVSEQMSLVMGPDYVLTFQETEGDVFDSVRARIRGGKGRMRKMGPDYLAYALMDAVVDDYFSTLERLGDEIELTEESVVTNPTPKVLQKIHHLKTEMIVLRKSIWPLRELVASLEKSSSRLIKPQTKIFFRDVYDHSIHAIDTVETFRDMVSGMLDIYLSGVSNRLNEVMKFLTIITTIFIPLSFIAGVYGMNFRHMPELNVPEAYPFVLVLMAVVGLTMLLYFKRKKWI